MNKRLLALLVVTLMAIGILAGCSGPGAPTAATTAAPAATTAASAAETTQATGSDYVYRVGFINIDNSDPNTSPAMSNFVDVVESADFAKAVGATKVEALTADSALDIAKQQSSVETMLAKGIDMLFLIGVDTAGNTAAVKMCNDAGVPVFMVGTEATGGDWKFIGFNEVELGQKQGEWVVANAKENANICYLEGTAGREAAVQRKQGFMDAIAKRADLKILSSQSADFDMAQGMQVTEDWIQSYGDKIDIIASANSMMIQGAIEALKAAKMNQQVTTVGVIHIGLADGSMIKDGDESYAVFVSWLSIGFLFAQVAQDVYQGKTIDDRTYIELQDVTTDNFDTVIKG